MAQEVQDNEQTIQTSAPHKRSKARDHRTSNKKSSIEIPLIAKKMNFVEKYIKEFKEREGSITNRHSVLQRSISPQPQSPSFKQIQQPQYSKNACIKYSTIRDQSSEQRIQSLGKAQVEYLRLKEKSQLPKLLPNITKSKQQNSNTITHEEVEKQIKKSVITKGGKRYYADLYLMKQGRDKIMSSLSTVGKHTLSANSQRDSYQEIIKNSLSYEQQIAADKQQFVRKKILQERQAKKQKMLRGKSMNWNVYYDMLALPPHERKKLKVLQKLEAEFSII